MDPSRNMSKYRNLLNGEHGEPPLVSREFRIFVSRDSSFLSTGGQRAWKQVCSGTCISGLRLDRLASKVYTNFWPISRKRDILSCYQSEKENALGLIWPSNRNSCLNLNLVESYKN